MLDPGVQLSSRGQPTGQLLLGTGEGIFGGGSGETDNRQPAEYDILIYIVTKTWFILFL